VQEGLADIFKLYKNGDFGPISNNSPYLKNGTR